MPLRIPKEYHGAVESLIKLAEESVDSLLDALKVAGPAISPRALAESISSSVPSIGVRSLTDLLTAIISLILSVTSREADQDSGMEFARAASNAKLGELEPGSEAETHFAARISRFLELAGGLIVTSKASSVYLAHQSLFRHARVLSDIRTIFGQGASIEPVAGMIVHQLEINVGEGDAERSRYIAMNIHDLRELRHAVDRAISKEAALRKVVNKSGLVFLEDTLQSHQK